MKLTTIKAARQGAATVHLGELVDWMSLPFCGALPLGRARRCDGTEVAHGTVNCRGCIVEANKRYLDIEQWVQISPRVRDLIAAVRAHAVANYDTGAWDIIVEAFSNSELAEVVRGCRTEKGAIAKVAAIVELYAERRAPHDAEIAAATETTTCSDPLQPEGEPDGSVVTAHYAHDGELLSVTRTRPGKVGHGETDLWTDAETYHPGWHGITIASPNLCGHDAPEGQLCRSNDCRRTACCPF